MPETLSFLVSKELNTNKISIFDPRLDAAHEGLGHDILPIPRKYTIIDALCYIFDNDPTSIADVLQSYSDKSGYALDLINALSEGIQSRSICLTCVKMSVIDMMRS